MQAFSGLGAYLRIQRRCRTCIITPPSSVDWQRWGANRHLQPTERSSRELGSRQNFETSHHSLSCAPPGLQFSGVASVCLTRRLQAVLIGLISFCVWRCVSEQLEKAKKPDSLDSLSVWRSYRIPHRLVVGLASSFADGGRAARSRSVPSRQCRRPG